jgi:hypothetical protein
MAAEEATRIGSTTKRHNPAETAVVWKRGSSRSLISGSAFRSFILSACRFRIRKKIDEEKYALKILHGDFGNVTSSPSVGSALQSVRA